MTFHELAGVIRSHMGGATSASPLEGALNALRTTWDDVEDVEERRGALSAQIGATADHVARVAIVSARNAFDQYVISAALERIDIAYMRSEPDGWNTWLRELGVALTDFRLGRVQRIAEHPVQFDPSRETVVKDMRRAAACILQSRWDEVDEAVAFLAAQDCMPTKTRARLIAIQAQLELWRFSEPERAAALLTQAELLGPNDVIVLATLGDLQLEQGNPESAVEYLQRAIDVAPGEANGYVSMGERFEKEKLYPEAEKWYRLAVTKAGRDGLGYDRLIRILVRQGALQANSAELADLLARRSAVDPEGDYDMLLTVGDICKELASLETDQAWYLAQTESWLERARAMNPDWPRAYALFADFYKEQRDLTRAETLGRRAVETGPEYPSGYLSLGALYEEQQRWADASLLYEQFPANPRRWKLYGQTLLARTRSKQGDRDRARSLLLAVLDEERGTDREQVYARTELESLAEDCYREHDDAGTAERILDDVLGALGKSFRATYHNLRGNMRAFQEDHARAVQEYRDAIQAEPSNPVYHRNLSDSLRSLAEFDEAEQEIITAFSLDHDEAKKVETLATLENVRGNQAFEDAEYAEAAQYFTRATELRPDVAVYYSNLALAWEYVKEPGSRVRALDKAIEAHGRAIMLTSTEDGSRLERLRRRRQLAAAYGEQALDFEWNVTPIVVEVAGDLVPLVSPNSRDLSPEVLQEVTAMRAAISSTLGVAVPGVRFRGSDGDPAASSYVVLLDEVPLAMGITSHDRRFFAGTADALSSLEATGEEADDPVTGAKGWWVTRDEWGKFMPSDSRLWSVTAFMLRHVEAILRTHIERFVGHEEVVGLLKQAGTVGDGLLGSPDKVSALTNVCKSLTSEQVTITAFSDLCRAFARLHQDGTRPRDIVERIRLVPEFRAALPGRHGRERLRTTERFEDVVRESIYRCGARAVLAMEPARCQTTLAAVRSAVHGAPLALVVADPSIRHFLRKLVEIEFPSLPVLSVAEALDEAPLRPDRLDVDLPPMPVDKPAVQRAAGPFDLLEDSKASDEGREPGADVSAAVEIRVSTRLLAATSTTDDLSLNLMLSPMREQLFLELGLLAPLVTVVADDTIPGDRFLVRINSAPAIELQGLAPDELFVAETVDRLRPLALHGRPAVNPATGGLGTILQNEPSTLESCREAQLSTWGPSSYLILQVEAHLHRAAASLITMQVATYMLDSVALAYPELAQMAVDRFGVAKLCRVLRHLVSEQISVRNLKTILDSLLCLDGTIDVDQERFIVFTANAEPVVVDQARRNTGSLPAWMLADYVRTCLRQYISHKYSHGSNSLAVYLLSPELEKWIRENTQGGVASPQKWQRLIDAVSDELDGLAPDGRTVVLTTIDIRAVTREALKESFPTLPVLSYQELSPELNITPIGRIGWT